MFRQPTNDRTSANTILWKKKKKTSPVNNCGLFFSFFYFVVSKVNEVTASEEEEKTVGEIELSHFYHFKQQTWMAGMPARHSNIDSKLINSKIVVNCSFESTISSVRLGMLASIIIIFGWINLRARFDQSNSFFIGNFLPISFYCIHSLSIIPSHQLCNSFNHFSVACR